MLAELSLVPSSAPATLLTYAQVMNLEDIRRAVAGLAAERRMEIEEEYAHAS